MTIYRIIDLLGGGCKDPAQVANELHPVWTGVLGCDGKVIKVHGEERIFLSAVDIGTQDLVDWKFSRHEDYLGIRALLKEVKNQLYYQPKMVVIDLDSSWKEAVQRVFPGVPIQVCVVHFERIVDRIIPKRKRTPIQDELKGMVRRVLYAENGAESRNVMDQLLLARRKRHFRDRKSLDVIRSLENNFELLTTHFRIPLNTTPNSFRSNNIAESVNDKIEMRLKMIRGYKEVRTATNSLRLIVMHYRFKPFASCKKKENNGKSPLNLAGVDTSRLNWVLYSQGTGSCSNARNVTVPYYLRLINSTMFNSNNRAL